jgi:hypothetical protein
LAVAILRVQGYKTTGELTGLGKHNVDRISHTNKDIDSSRSHENITLKNCVGTYNQMFNYVTRDLQKQHEEQMKTTRKSRQKTFNQKINDDKADIACEFLMTATPEYFEGKSREEIEQWAQTSLDFVIKKIGIEEKNVLHAVVHMDEKTPHLHVVAVPLVEKYDGRRKKDILAISRKHFIKTREDMAQVQTDYVDHLKENGLDLERGQEKSGAKHLDVARYKLQETQKDLKEIEMNLGEKEQDLLEKNEQLESIEQKIKMNLEAVPDRNFKFKKDLPKEIKVEVKPKILGKPEIIETETENTVFNPKQLKSIEDKINAAVTIKKDYERLQTTDLVQDNKGLRSHAIASMNENRDLKHEIAKLRNENNELRSEVSYLKRHISDLKHEIGSIYKSTKEYFKDRTSDFKRHVRDFVSKVSEKEPQGQFEQLHKRERRREQNREMER